MAEDHLVCRHQFPPAIIRHVVWRYVRFTLSYRDVEDLLTECGLDMSYETVRRKFRCFVRARILYRRPPTDVALMEWMPLL